MYRDQGIGLRGEVLARCVSLIDHFDILRGPGMSKFSLSGDTIAVYQPVLDEVVPGSWQRAALVALYAGCQIPSHCDESIAPAVRCHLPLLTNEDCWSFAAGQWQSLALGRLYAVDPSQPHGAVNWGSTVRVHLMIDTVRS